ncbi:nucleoside monophosphate kinase [Candidatus Cytomitobacter indipagum]|uniref:Adenylate kinase n=1 Tax=Candidatus Cytomitobacter indipagum TaxID=2601575 RepID=A0A5C0UDR1_9PROT|nr:nucleoside monophosphate kinase [Candidatus Cytomitobacter indipagum]QEK38195.1 nucleoside monophosphate kinase [Candidatus Cytomitobacter indipagum]
MLNLVFLGPPGSGKGTQASIICKKFDLELISMGDMLRAEQDSQTELGKQINSLISQGNLVPLNVIIDILKQKIQSTNKGILFDGVPRSLDQANALENILHSLKMTLDAVIVFNIDYDTATKRMKHRYICKDCNAILSMQDSDEKICDLCQSSLIEKREDDICDQAIEKRLSVFEEESSHIIDFYKKKGILLEINACKNQDEVTKEILSNLSK